MSQGNDFANYASSAEDRSSASEDVWFVAVSSDDIKQMNVDQLDEAFRLGVITAQTAVWTEGMEAWAPLGEVADLDSSDEETSGEVEAAPAFAGSNGYSTGDAFAAPVARDITRDSARDSARESAASQQPAHSGWHNPFEAPGSAAHTERTREETLHSAVHESIAPRSITPTSIGPTSFAPVTSSYAPSAGGSLGHSTGPVALNVDEDMPAVNRGRRFRPERWALAVAGVVAVAVIGFNNKDLFSSSSSSVAAAEQQASAAALIARPYEAPADNSEKQASGTSSASAAGTTAPAAVKSEPADDGDAPIGSLKGEKAEDEEESSEEAPAAASASSKPGSTSGAKDKEAVRGGMAKAFAKGSSGKAARAERASRASKSAKAKPRRTPSRSASKSKKGNVPRASSAFDPLNGSLP